VATVGVAIARRQVPDDLPKLLRLDAAPDRLARIAFSSDAHFGSAGANRDAALSVMRAVNGGPYDAFFVLGDFSEMGFPDDGLFDAARSLATEMTRVPVATAMGNHDALLGGDARYRKLFNERLYYRVDSGTTHVLVANILWDDASLDLSQRAWLEKSLDGIPAGDFVIFASHRFLRSSGYVEPSTGKAWYTDEQLGGEFAAWLAAKGVDLVVSGHNHYMEFLGPDGDNLACAVVGAMGGRRDPPPSWVDPRSAWLNDRDFGFLDVSVFADRATLAFRDPEGKALYETAIAFSPASGKP
jgi:3',5'-cyclic AMP phosphodiesterase CpdA